MPSVTVVLAHHTSCAEVGMLTIDAATTVSTLKSRITDYLMESESCPMRVFSALFIFDENIDSFEELITNENNKRISDLSIGDQTNVFLEGPISWDGGLGQAVEKLWAAHRLVGLGIPGGEELEAHRDRTKETLQIATEQFPLHYATAKANFEAIKAFANVLDVNSFDGNGRTPLHIAAHNCNIDAMCLLISCGANILSVDKEGYSPLRRALLRGAPESSNKQDPDERPSSSNVRVVEVLVSRGAGPNAVDEWGRTPLHFIASSGDVPIVQLLLSMGANVNAVDANGRTALHWAASGGNRKVIRALSTKGADINAVDCDGHVPLHFAAFSGCMASIELLSALGANKRALLFDGRSPLDLLRVNRLPLEKLDRVKALLTPKYL